MGFYFIMRPISARRPKYSVSICAVSISTVLSIFNAVSTNSTMSTKVLKSSLLAPVSLNLSAVRYHCNGANHEGNSSR